MKKPPRKVQPTYKWPKNYRELIKAAPKQVAAASPPKLTSEQISQWLAKRDYYGRPKLELRSAFEFELSTNENETEPESIPLLNVKTDFYKWHSVKERVRGFSRPIIKGVDPIRLMLNPAATGDGCDAFHPSVWYAIYRHGFWVRIEQNILHPMYGPHVAKLYIQICGWSGIHSPKQEWLGTCQFDCVFAAEDQIRIQLRRAIRTRDYFCSEDAEDIPIVFGRDREEQSEELEGFRA